MKENSFIEKEVVGQDSFGRPVYENINNVKESSKNALKEINFILSYFKHKQDQYETEYVAQSYFIQKEIELQKIKLDLLKVVSEADVL